MAAANIFGRGRPAPGPAPPPGQAPPETAGAAATADVSSAARIPTLVELSAEFFPLVLSLRGPEGLGSPADARRRILEALDRLEEQGRSHGYATHLLDGARFALVAMIDEAILSSQWSGRELWRTSPLQRELFKMNVAGEEFYTRLDRLRQNVDENRPLLEVCYACLIMGFEGRYKLLGREKLETLIRELASDLTQGQAWRMENLSPSWRRPDEFLETVGAGIPVWATIAGIVALILILILVFRGVALHDAARAGEAIQGYLRNTGG